MSDELIVIPDNVPAYILNPEAARVMNEDAAAGIGVGASARIGLKQSKFRLIDASGEETVLKPKDLAQEEFLAVIVMRARHPFEKGWYAKPYDPADEPSAPDCFSLDGERPDPSSPLKQCETCAGCPQNQFGSGKNAKGEPTKGKACPDKKILAVFCKGSVYKLSVPPASLKNWVIYVKALSSRGIPLGNVKTLVGFDEKADYQVLTFQFGGFLDEKHIPKIIEYSQSDEANLIIDPPGVVPALPAPATKSAPPEAAVEKPKTTRKPKAAKKEEPAPPEDDDMGLGDTKDPVKVAAGAGPALVEDPADEGEPAGEAGVSDEDLANDLGL